jgi:single-strand DNA-binding protein
MQVLTGRITADAKVNSVKGDKKVVNFSIAINDSYKSKGSETATKVVTFFNCSYWRNEAIAEYLTKGTIVELCGRISVNAWINNDNEPKAGLNFHTTEIKLLGKSGTHETTAKEERQPAANNSAEPAVIMDDLPF